MKTLTSIASAIVTVVALAYAPTSFATSSTTSSVAGALSTVDGVEVLVPRTRRNIADSTGVVPLTGVAQRWKADVDQLKRDLGDTVTNINNTNTDLDARVTNINNTNIELKNQIQNQVGGYSPAWTKFFIGQKRCWSGLEAGLRSSVTVCNYIAQNGEIRASQEEYGRVLSDVKILDVPQGNQATMSPMYPGHCSRDAQLTAYPIYDRLNGGVPTDWVIGFNYGEMRGC